MAIDIRTADTRFETTAPGRSTFHSFSFGTHYDPHNTSFGALLALNDERLDAGAGYAEHGHADTEIVTVVISGQLQHRDSTGQEHVLRAGQVQVLSAGSGVRHEEGAQGKPARFLQAWLRPDDADTEPMYSCLEAPPQGAGLQLVVVGDNETPAPLRLRSRGAALYLGWLSPHESVELPDATRQHLFVLSGSALVGERALEESDAARLLFEGGREVIAGEAGAWLCVWALA